MLTYLRTFCHRLRHRSCFRFSQHSIEIIGHYEKQATTFIILRTLKGGIRIEQISQLIEEKSALEKFSHQDVFLLGYLFGSEHERRSRF